MEMGQVRRGVFDETCCEWMTFTVRRTATSSKRLTREVLGLEPSATHTCDGQVRATLGKMCVRRSDLLSTRGTAGARTDQEERIWR